MSQIEDKQDQKLYEQLEAVSAPNLAQAIVEKEKYKIQDDIEARDRHGDLGVRQAWRRTKIWWINCARMTISCLILSFIIIILWPIFVYIRNELGTPEGTKALVACGIVAIAVASVSIAITFLISGHVNDNNRM